jgi:hypothetical protein
LYPAHQVAVIYRFGDKFADAKVHGRRPRHHVVSGSEQNDWRRRTDLF